MLFSRLVYFFFQQFLGTGPLELKHWLFFIPFAILIFVLDEIGKWLKRRIEREKTGEQSFDTKVG